MYEFQNFYYAALAAIHLGFAWGLRNVWVALEQRRWALLGVAAVLLTLLGYAIFRVYEVLPALWWPGTREHFVERVGACAVSITLLVALTIPLRTKKNEAALKECGFRMRRPMSFKPWLPAER